MLYALVARVEIQEIAEIEPSSGRFAHALFLDLIRQIDPTLSEMLHAPASSKPFTVSPLLQPALDRPLSGVVRPGQPGRFRFTILDDRLFAALLRRFQSVPPSTLRVGTARLGIVELSTVDGGWSGVSSPEELMGRATDEGEQTIQFATPTSFSFGNGPAGSRLALFPQAPLLFSSLLRRWRALGGPPLPAELNTLLAEQLVETAYDLETVALQMGQRPELGFVGWCRFTAKGHWSESARRALNALADFAFYAGVGRKTTMGMGQARRIR
jgi:CRISPR-associated endoribonuclease Cas6